MGLLMGFALIQKETSHHEDTKSTKPFLAGHTAVAARQQLPGIALFLFALFVSSW